MAVMLNSNSSYRADFMVSESPKSQKGVQGSAKQDDGFSKLLDNNSGEKKTQIGSVNSSNSVNSTYKAPEPKAELERVCEVPEKEALVVDSTAEMRVVCKSISDQNEDVREVIETVKANIPSDALELAQKIVDGDVKIDEVPTEKLTFELLKAIVAVKMGSKDDEEKNAVDVFDPAMQFVLQNNVAMVMTEQIYEEISVILETEDITVERIAEIGSLLTEETVSEDIITLADSQSDVPMAEIQMSEQAVEMNSEAAETEKQFAEGFEVKEKPKSEAVSSANETKSDNEGEVIVRKIAAPEDKESFSQQNEQSKSEDNANNQQPRVSKEISEELEMLRNAKLGKVKADNNVQESVKTEQPETAAPVHTANPLNADSPIVFAGSNGEMITVRPSEVIAQVTKLVEQTISETREQTEYSMVLNPEELGKITVKLVKAADGAVSVTIVAENANTQRMLEQNSELMQNNLKNSGVQLQSWQTVNEAHQETMQREYNGSSKNPYYRDEDENASQDEEDGESFADIIAAM